MSDKLDKLKQVMLDCGVHDLTIKSFEYYYELLSSGSTGYIHENEISSPTGENLVFYDELSSSDFSIFDRLAVVKLNGGLGTSMGLEKAKCMITAKDNLSFLDILCKQTLELRKKTGSNFPLIFMNSFNTQQDTVDYVTNNYSGLLSNSIPIDFTQSKFPKIKQADLSYLDHEEENLNWNPPGHGDIYSSFLSSGLLDILMNNGIEYLFISNSDNLGAIVDPKIYNYVYHNSLSFLMEVCIRSEMDKKGGHLAQTKSKQLILRESAQCPPQELDFFQDIKKYMYFNTNSLWVSLKKLKLLLEENDGQIKLPIIVNPKEVDGEKVYQLETAMGAALSVFKDSKAIIVPRNRFIPVKKTNDLLLLRSDFYRLTKDFTLDQAEEGLKINIDLDPVFYSDIEDFEKRFSQGIPSLKHCRNLKIKGKVDFGSDVILRGNLTIKNNSKENTSRLENIDLSSEP